MGGGDDELIVGTVPLIPDRGNRTLEFPEGVPVADTENMTNGNTATLFVLGDGQNDRFEVNHNRGKLYLHGGAGNDRFLLRTFLVLKEDPDNPEEITNLTNLFGGSGDNRYDYLQNAPVFINGGPGVDTIVVIGTPIGDIFVITDDYIAGAGRIVTFVGVEAVEVDGAGGPDQIYVLATGDKFETTVTGGSGDDTIHVGGDAPTLVFDPPSFTYTPPAFEVPLPPELVYTTTTRSLDGITFTVDIFEWLARGGTLRPDVDVSQSQAAGLSIVNGYVNHLKALFGIFGAMITFNAVIDPASITARNRFGFFSFLIGIGKVEITVGSMDVTYGFGRWEKRSQKIQPPPITVDPEPFAFKAPRNLDASKILGRLTIRGGDQFETAGDKVIFHNEEGRSDFGALYETEVTRQTQVGERFSLIDHEGVRFDANDIDDDADGIVDESNELGTVPIYGDDIDPDSGLAIKDRFLILEGAGLGIQANTLAKDGITRYSGLELVGIENLELRLADGRTSPFDDGADALTVQSTPATTKLTVWAGKGNDTINIQGLGGAATVYGGDGNDVITVSSSTGDLADIMSRLIVDGDRTLTEQIDPVLASEAFVQPFLDPSARIVVVARGQIGTKDGRPYYTAEIVRILATGAEAFLEDGQIKLRPDGTPYPLYARSVVLDEGGAVIEKLVQEKGVAELGKWKTSDGSDDASKRLYFDSEGNEVTGDKPNTGIPVIVAAGSLQLGLVRPVYVDPTFKRVFDQFGQNVVTNGTLGEFVASNGISGGWKSENIDSAGGWRQGGTFILNSNGAAGSDPTITQQLTGLHVGVTYEISGSYRSFYRYGSTAGTSFRVKIGSTTVFAASRDAGVTDALAGPWRTFTVTFTATAATHTLSISGETDGNDAAYEVDNIVVRSRNEASYVTDFLNGSPLFIDNAGRRTTAANDRPSLIPINDTALMPFTRVFDEIAQGAGGNDVLNVVNTGDGANTDVVLGTYRIPVALLSGGRPVIFGDDPVNPYYLNPLFAPQRVYFGGEAVIDPFTGEQMRYKGGEFKRDLFTGAILRDPNGVELEHADGRPDAAHRGRAGRLPARRHPPLPRRRAGLRRVRPPGLHGQQPVQARGRLGADLQPPPAALRADLGHRRARRDRRRGVRRAALRKERAERRDRPARAGLDPRHRHRRHRRRDRVRRHAHLQPDAGDRLHGRGRHRQGDPAPGRSDRPRRDAGRHDRGARALPRRRSGRLVRRREARGRPGRHRRERQHRADRDRRGRAAHGREHQDDQARVVPLLRRRQRRRHVPRARAGRRSSRSASTASSARPAGPSTAAR